jgi:hypothetical protein
MSTIPKLIIPDADIARLAIRYWPEPTHWQARTMVTIALCETLGDAYALYLNTTGMFAGTLDRGLWAINEAAIIGVCEAMSTPTPDPHQFVDPEASAGMARLTWDYRFGVARDRGKSWADPLTYAYQGWNTYRDKDTKYAAVWPGLWARAGAAITEATRPSP